MSTPARTTVAQVNALLGARWDGTTDVSPYIEIASSFVDSVAACATAKGKTLTAVQLELIERVMAAYYYMFMDPAYKSRSTASASGSWDFDMKDYTKQAIMIDPSGCVNALLNRYAADVDWLGKPPSSQIPYEQRR